MKIINSISEFHRLVSLPAPLHPLISVIRVADISYQQHFTWGAFALNFYCVSLKTGIQAKVKYGQQYYDYDKGVMTFVAPKQVQSLEITRNEEKEKETGTGYALFFHPDLLYKYPLAGTIKNYGFFSYAVNEALHLSDKEEQNIAGIFQKISEEYQYIDRHTQDIIVAQIDLLLNYSKRFYERQFITRKAANHNLLTRMEQLVDAYFNEPQSVNSGLPTVEGLAGQLHVSAHYLSDMLRSLTGQSAQRYIQDKLIDKAKEYLSLTEMTVGEIAYRLGFSYPQSFNKLFKKKTAISPLEFRQTLN